MFIRMRRVSISRKAFSQVFGFYVLTTARYLHTTHSLCTYRCGYWLYVTYIFKYLSNTFFAHTLSV